ncbi:SLAM family member 9-like [Paramisgurnus dabryanus]|uniref:SLAM family member 9-like n=1 Tax=Paramisgurnus dabryanus TaxID=90735 RepID=UPI003CCFAD3F
MGIFIFYSPLFLIVEGVFGDEVKSESVMKGDSVILHTDTVKQTDDLIVWYYGPEDIVIARINEKENIIMLSDDERFRDRVMMDDQTGDLIITNITHEHTGLYTLKISRNNAVFYIKSNVTVYARLPVPVISRVSSQCSSSSVSNCVVLCSVMNVRDVSLSWYKGNSLLSLIHMYDLNIRLSLPLEVEHQDTNTYSCVVSNPIRKQTQHLNIAQLCKPCSVSPERTFSILPFVFTVKIWVFCIIIFLYIRKRRKLIKQVS